MWYETENNEWINGSYFQKIIIDDGDMCGVDGDYNLYPLTGRISPVPFPDKFK